MPGILDPDASIQVPWLRTPGAVTHTGAGLIRGR